jgi:LuxR family maltose regulon positive regulatory protein
LEILRLIDAGLTNREIADLLFVSVGTVKTHTHRVYAKLDVTGRTLARARGLGLLEG